MDFEENYTPQSPSPGEDYTKKKTSKRRFIGRLLLVLVIIAVPVWCAFHYHLSWDITDSGFSFSLRPSGQDVPMVIEQPPSMPSALPATTEAAAATLERDIPISDITLEVTETDYSNDAWSLQAIYAHVRPSVVSIVVSTNMGQATGSGIIMSEDGYIITNNHVIDGGTAIDVLLYDDTVLSATLVGADTDSDLAVLKVESDNLIAAQFGDSDSVAVGDAVVAIGDPLGITLRGTMTDGIISAINRNLDNGDGTMTLLQTNAALNSGNSGGPLINDQGQVIGINAMKIGSQYTSTTVEGLGFAIPIASAKPIIDQLIGQGYVAGQPAIGIAGETLPAAVRVYYRLPAGVYITYIDPDCDAALQGLSAGDIILSANGTTIETIEQLETVLEGFSPGDSLSLEVYRQGEVYDMTIILIDKNAP